MSTPTVAVPRCTCGSARVPMAPDRYDCGHYESVFEWDMNCPAHGLDAPEPDDDDQADDEEDTES